ncbi:MAG: glycine zipper domain-containing protein [Maricaulaceae bacterium]|jgi:outer membrane lipoprotein SlyB
MSASRLPVRAAVAAVLLSTVSLSACAGGMGTGTYSRSQVGQVGRVEAGQIVQARPVTIEGTKSGVGSTAGVIAGGALGSEAGGDRTGQIVGGVAGAVVGGLIGAAVEEGVTRQAGYSYVVQLQSGDMVTVTQADPQPLQPGQPVWVEYGPRTRVTPRY